MYEGTEHRLVHVPDPLRSQDLDGFIGAYACAETSAGAIDFEVCGLDEIEKVRSCAFRTDSPDSPWVKWPIEMRKKIPLKRLCKRLPLQSHLLSHYYELEDRRPQPEVIESPDIEVIEPKTHTAPLLGRDGINARIASEWDKFEELDGDVSVLSMEGTLEDYMNEKLFPDEDANAFANKLKRERIKLEASKKVYNQK